MLLEHSALHFFAFGVNHRTAEVAVRERLALGTEAIRSLYRLAPEPSPCEWMIVSTCNRTECYLLGTPQHVEWTQAAISRASGFPWPGKAAFLKQDEEAVRHVLEVAAGMQSMVLGDAQILNQVKEAYRIAVEEESVSAVLHRLLHTAFRTAKRVITETKFAKGNASVAGTAAQMAQEAVADRLAKGQPVCEVLVVGAGAMGRLALGALDRSLPIRLLVTNRTLETARAAAQTCNAGVVPWGERHRAAAAADIVLVATGAETYALEAKKLDSEKKAAGHTLVIDIAMPRNADPAISALPGFSLCDLDMLNRRIASVTARRQAELPEAHTICDEMLADFISWYFHHQAMQPAVHAILETFEIIRTRELERNASHLSREAYTRADRLTRSIMQKVMAVPIVRLKTMNAGHIDYVNGIKVLEALFARTACEELYEDLPESGLDCPFHEQPQSEIKWPEINSQGSEFKVQGSVSGIRFENGTVEDVFILEPQTLNPEP